MTKYALVVGSDYTQVEDIHLNGCTNDARAMMNILIDRGFNRQNIRLLTDDHGDTSKYPTPTNVGDGLRWLCTNRSADDIIFFSFAGHGTRIPQVADDFEVDMKDEAIVLEGPDEAFLLLDNDIKRFFSLLPEGTNATCVFDCCHSNTVVDSTNSIIGRDFDSHIASTNVPLKNFKADEVWTLKNRTLPVSEVTKRFSKALGRELSVTNVSLGEAMTLSHGPASGELSLKYIKDLLKKFVNRASPLLKPGTLAHILSDRVSDGSKKLWKMLLKDFTTAVLSGKLDPSTSGKIMKAIMAVNPSFRDPEHAAVFTNDSREYWITVAQEINGYLENGHRSADIRKARAAPTPPSVLGSQFGTILRNDARGAQMLEKFNHILSTSRGVKDFGGMLSALGKGFVKGLGIANNFIDTASAVVDAASSVADTLNLGRELGMHLRNTSSRKEHERMCHSFVVAAHHSSGERSFFSDLGKGLLQGAVAASSLAPGVGPIVSVVGGQVLSATGLDRSFSNSDVRDFFSDLGKGLLQGGVAATSLIPGVGPIVNTIGTQVLSATGLGRSIVPVLQSIEPNLGSGRDLDGLDIDPEEFGMTFRKQVEGDTGSKWPNGGHDCSGGEGHSLPVKESHSAMLGRKLAQTLQQRGDTCCLSGLYYGQQVHDRGFWTDVIGGVKTGLDIATQITDIAAPLLSGRSIGKEWARDIARLPMWGNVEKDPRDLANSADIWGDFGDGFMEALIEASPCADAGPVDRTFGKMLGRSFGEHLRKDQNTSDIGSMLPGLLQDQRAFWSDFGKGAMAVLQTDAAAIIAGRHVSDLLLQSKGREFDTHTLSLNPGDEGFRVRDVATVFSSCLEEEVSFETKWWGDRETHGVFTAAMLSALEENPGLTNKELIQKIGSNLKEGGWTQHPTLAADGRGLGRRFASA